MRRQSSSVVPASSSSSSAEAARQQQRQRASPSNERRAGATAAPPRPSGSIRLKTATTSGGGGGRGVSSGDAMPYRPLASNVTHAIPVGTAADQNFIQPRRRRRRRRQKGLRPQFKMNLGLDLTQLDDLPHDEKVLVVALLVVMALFALGSILGFLYLLTASLPDDGGGYGGSVGGGGGGRHAGVANTMHRVGRTRGERVRNLVGMIRDKFRRNDEQRRERERDDLAREHGKPKRHKHRREHEREKKGRAGQRDEVNFDAADEKHDSGGGEGGGLDTDNAGGGGGGGADDDDGRADRNNAASAADDDGGDGGGGGGGGNGEGDEGSQPDLDDENNDRDDNDATAGREEARRLTHIESSIQRYERREGGEGHVEREVPAAGADQARSWTVSGWLLGFVPGFAGGSGIGSSLSIRSGARGGGPFPYQGPPVDPDHDFASWVPPGPDRYLEYLDGRQPYEIADFARRRSDKVGRTRLPHVRSAMRHAFGGYKQYAWGHDGVTSSSARPHDSVGGGLGATLVGSLDTLWFMGLLNEYAAGREWVTSELKSIVDGGAGRRRRSSSSSSSSRNSVLFYDGVAKVIGGILAAHCLTADGGLLKVADELGTMLEVAFDERTGIPYRRVYWSAAEGGARDDDDDDDDDDDEEEVGRIGATPRHLGGDAGTSIPLAELGVQLEYVSLSRSTGKRRYGSEALRALDAIRPLEPEDGLYPSLIGGASGATDLTEPTEVSLTSEEVGLGRMGGAFYSTLLRTWLQGGREKAVYRDMYDRAMQGLHDELLHRSTPTGLVYVARRDEGGRLEHVMDQESCFLAGTLALGAYTDPMGLDSTRAKRDLKTGRAIALTCFQMYARTATGLAPDDVIFEEGADFVSRTDQHSLLPHTLEAFFTLYSLTGDPIYREFGWEIFQSLERFCKTRVAYGSLSDANNPSKGPWDDKLSSLFFSATMKYSYLLQDPDAGIDLVNSHVFTTQGHVLQMQEPRLRANKEQSSLMGIQ